MDNYSTGKKNNHIDNTNVGYMQKDISDIDIYKGMPVHVDGVFHLAALARIQPSFEHPSLSFEANSLGTQYLMEWVRKKECPLVCWFIINTR